MIYFRAHQASTFETMATEMPRLWLVTASSFDPFGDDVPSSGPCYAALTRIDALAYVATKLECAADELHTHSASTGMVLHRSQREEWDEQHFRYVDAFAHAGAHDPCDGDDACAETMTYVLWRSVRVGDADADADVDTNADTDADPTAVEDDDEDEAHTPSSTPREL